MPASVEIKRECDELYAVIKKAQDRIAELRKMCEHENTFEGLWSWRECPAKICCDCGACLQFLNSENQFFQT